MEMRLVSIPSQFDLRHTQIVASNGVKSMNQLNCLLPVAENHLDWPFIRLISERDYTNSIDFPFTTVVRFNAVTKILIAGKVLDFSVSSTTGLKVSHLHLQHAQQVWWHNVRSKSQLQQIPIENERAVGHDDADDNDNEKDNQSSIPMVVKVSKTGGPCLEFGVTAYADEIVIDSLSVKDPDMAEDQLPYEGPRFDELDENLQKAFHKYLEIRGIKPSVTNFLHEYMVNKEHREYTNWLKNLKKSISGEEICKTHLNFSDSAVKKNPAVFDLKEEGVVCAHGDDIESHTTFPFGITSAVFGDRCCLFGFFASSSYSYPNNGGTHFHKIAQGLRNIRDDPRHV
ncbi:hypothetical protein LXL04_014933 [Taraxacum kok-saghyz]